MLIRSEIMEQTGNTADQGAEAGVRSSDEELVHLNQGSTNVVTGLRHNKSTLKCLTVVCVVSCLVCVGCLIAIVILMTNFDFPAPTSRHESTPNELTYKHPGSELNGKDGPFERMDIGEKRNKTTGGEHGNNRKYKGDQGERGERGEKGEKGESAGPLLAAHFRSDFDDHQKLFKPDTSYSFLHPAGWVDPDKNPLQEVSDGVYEVRYTGVYLVYSTVSFYDAQIKLYYSIKVNGKSKLTCSDGVDRVESKEFGENIKHKTCSITGLLYLNKNDKIELQNLSAYLRIDITKDKTFFGLVLLNIYED